MRDATRVSAASWPTTTLGALIDAGDAELQTGPFGTMLHASAYTSSGVPVVAVKHIGDNQLSHEDLPRIDSVDAERLERYRLREGDILFARKGSVDRRALVKADEADWIQGSDCIRLRFRSPEVNPRFVSYVLGTAAHRSWILQHAHGATMPSLNQEILRMVPLPIPPLSEQHRVAAMLGALDDKIELNRRMNRTLESIARAIFKSWFVDFDPVRRKMEGKTGGELGLPPSLAAHFPASLTLSDLGEIPFGWTNGKLSDECSITMGQSPPGETYNELGEGLPFFQGRRDFGSRFPSRRVFCSSPTRTAEAGDVLVSVRAPVGTVNVATEPCCLGRGVAGIRHSCGASNYVFELLGSMRDSFADFEAGGTVFGSINAKDLSALKIIVPPPEIVAAYEGQVAVYGRLMRQLADQSKMLALARDALLPRLLSGELRLQDVPQMTPTATRRLAG